MNNALDRDSGGFAPANAQCRDAAPQIVCFQCMQQRNEQARPCGTDGMAERAGTAIDVQLLARNSEIALRGHCHDSEGLVDFEQIDIADAPADSVE